MPPATTPGIAWAKKRRTSGVARGEMGPHSDYDLLVIKGGKFDCHRVTTAIYHHLSGEAAVDVVVVTPEDVERYRDTHCLVICPALRRPGAMSKFRWSPLCISAATNFTTSISIGIRRRCSSKSAC